MKNEDLTEENKVKTSEEKAENSEQKSKDPKSTEQNPTENKPQAAEDSSKKSEDKPDQEEENGKGKREDQSDQEEKDEKDDKKSKSFFKKKPDPRDQKIADLTDRVQRQMAEFDNFRKRTDKEKSEMFDAGARHILEKILPVVDNFERAIALRPEGEDNAYADGIEKIYKGLIKTLDDLDVKEIDAKGKEFDPNFHNAVMHVEDESLGENEVAEVLQKGYTFHDVVIRHAMVKVAN
ncbi:nucleotide exchange factor GrpE [Lachnospiraceae bacterium YH-ros2226]